MEIKQTLKRYSRRIVASGSPFRILRKAALYAKNPLATTERLLDQTGLRRNLSPEVTKSLENMNRDGFSYAHGELDSALTDELIRIIDERLAETANVGENMQLTPFMSQLSRPEDLLPKSIFVRFALQPNLVKLAAAYLKMVPYLSAVQVLVSTGTERGENGQWMDSQLWHKDYQDTKCLRLWLYLTEVTEQKHGPFTYLPKTYSQRVKNTFFPRRITDEQMEKAGLAGHAQAVCGSRRTAFYIDTNCCYHLGSRVALGERRIGYVATFNTHAEVYPLYNDIQLDGTQSRIEKLLLTA